MKNNILFIAALNGLVVVILGAFGAHGLEARLTAEALAVWQTAVQYQMFHTLALLAVGVLELRQPSAVLRSSAWSFTSGILIFSGSLYVLALSGVKILGAITPLGGVAFIIGWALLAWHQWSVQTNEH